MTLPRFMRFLAVGTAIAALPATSSAQTACAPSSQVLGTTDGSTFTLFYGIAGGVTWTAANAAACTPGGGLAVLDNTTRTTAVSAWLSPFLNNNAVVNSIGLGPWVGAYSNGPTGAPFSWNNGSPISGGANGFNWAGGQPDWSEAVPGGGRPQGVLFYNANKSLTFTTFGDYGQGCGAGQCGAGLITAFVWETKTEVPEPSSYALMASGLLALGVISRRRKA